MATPAGFLLSTKPERKTHEPPETLALVGSACTARGGDRHQPCFDGLDAARVVPELDRLLASLENH